MRFSPHFYQAMVLSGETNKIMFNDRRISKFSSFKISEEKKG